MKTPILLCSLFLALLCSSCSSDDGGINNSIVGTWKLYKSSTGEGTPISLLSCEKNTTFTFTKDMFTRKYYEANADNTDCLPVQEVSSKYKIDGDKIIFLDANGNVIVSHESEFTFSVSEHHLSVFDSDPSTGKVVEELYFERQ